MDKYYDMSKSTAKDVVNDFLTEEAIENAKSMEAEGYECLGVFDAKDFMDGKFEKQEDEWLAAME